MGKQRFDGLEETSVGLQKLREALQQADTVLIGAGAGLSASAGLVYTGERFLRDFPDFSEKYRFQGMYAGGVLPPGTFEEHWE